MPFGLEDNELWAHIDLYERRQQRINRIKSQGLSASTTSSTSKPEFTVSGHSAKPSPPPPYRTKHIEDKKAKGVGSRTSASVNETAMFSIPRQEQLPPYTAASSSSTRQSPGSRRLFDPRGGPSLPEAHNTSRTNGPTVAGIPPQQAPPIPNMGPVYHPRRQPPAQGQGNTSASQAAGTTAQPSTRQSNRTEGMKS